MIRRIAIGLLLLSLVAGTGFGLWWQGHMRVVEQVRRMPVQSVDLDQLADGVYPGSFSYSRTTVEVAVHVRNHRIESIVVTSNRESERARSAEGVIPSVLSAQSPNVDVVAGATTTSKAILKAIEQALSGGK